ncbi:hypothetical protein RFI_23544 [Reticulomyxa filosa]|uniref:Uncharacterized protein n=1 Tax=Reticulomyxa filosa TaxID=46433 RepID=X6MIJ0_RETFI|nr:hypothetical protein RFI_23544 [Reticulomyxa filosa]|eukprot:ETO13823.1 hypothetical protein RFI_23544 [Reticulomyxa filosa]
MSVCFLSFLLMFYEAHILPKLFKLREPANNVLFARNELLEKAWRESSQILTLFFSSEDKELEVLPSVYSSSYFEYLRQYLKHGNQSVNEADSGEEWAYVPMPFEKTIRGNNESKVWSLPLSKIKVKHVPKEFVAQSPYGHSLYMRGYLKYCYKNQNLLLKKKSYQWQLGDDNIFDNEYNALFRLIDDSAEQQVFRSLPERYVQTYRYLPIAGLYNTGTNALVRLFNRNCFTQANSTYVRLMPQVPWLKHSLVTPGHLRRYGKFLTQEGPILGIVIIKDPLTWIKSVCKAPYYIRFTNIRWFVNECPANVNRSKLLWHAIAYPSLAHLWSQWLVLLYIHTHTNIHIFCINVHMYMYSAYFEKVISDKFSFVMIRFEDLLFQPNSILKLFCDHCVRAKLRLPKHRRVAEKSTKSHGDSRNRSQALDTYGNTNYRVSQFSTADLIYLKLHLNQSLLDGLAINLM